ncbi:MAG: Flp family type IVb pilin [Actinomycetota bacterium]|nr:Flp family type IVb pilin [Actinomycetota bacterium]
MLRLWTALQSRISKGEEGAALVEYALLVALIAIVAIVAIGLVGTAVTEKFNTVAVELG